MKNILNRIYLCGVAVIREPLFQFLLLGAAIFIAAEISTGMQDDRMRIITVDDNLENYLGNLYNARFGASPDREILERLVESYIREEIMYREAIRLGLAEQDEIIRRRLVQKMEYLLTDTEDSPDPEASVIRDYYDNHAADYTLPARVSFRHLFFGSDSANGADAELRAHSALHLIRSDRLAQALAGTDDFPLNDRYLELDQQQARRLFGNSEFVRKLYEIPTGDWSGPYESGYGRHLVLVEERIEPRLPPYEQVQDRVISDWRRETGALRYEAVMQDLMSHYEIRRTAGAGRG